MLEQPTVGSIALSDSLAKALAGSGRADSSMLVLWQAKALLLEGAVREIMMAGRDGRLDGFAVTAILSDYGFATRPGMDRKAAEDNDG